MWGDDAVMIELPHCSLNPPLLRTLQQRTSLLNYSLCNYPSKPINQSIKMAPKVLIVLTSVGTMPTTGKPTGWYLVSSPHHHQSSPHSMSWWRG